VLERRSPSAGKKKPKYWKEGASPSPSEGGDVRGNGGI
jgi:hypothetical protein